MEFMLNRVMLRMNNVRYLARQGLALQGRYRDLSEGCEADSNFMQLLKLRVEDNPLILKWLERSRDKFTCLDIQNEILSIMAKSIYRGSFRQINGLLLWTKQI